MVQHVVCIGDAPTIDQRLHLLSPQLDLGRQGIFAGSHPLLVPGIAKALLHGVEGTGLPELLCGFKKVQLPVAIHFLLVMLQVFVREDVEVLVEHGRSHPLLRKCAGLGVAGDPDGPSGAR